ncbi:MAG: DNA-binding protein [Euryarchaeota archaeon]|nr:DNA-binding protein [Euryarchaeota archaeon]
MSDEELETLKRKKAQQMVADQQATQARLAQEQAAKQDFEVRKQALLRQILTPEARERLNSLRMTRPDFVDQVEMQLIALLQSGQLQNAITDEQLRVLLARLAPRRREITITRK